MAGNRLTLVQFWTELKRRRVVRVGIVYVLAAVAVLQAADVLVPALRLPEWVMTLLALIAILGLPVVLALTWVFDLTPSGVIRTGALEEAAQGGDLAKSTSLDNRNATRPAFRFRVAPLYAVAALAVLTGAFVLWRFSGPRSVEAVSVDPEMFAVLPFRVSGADPSLAYLREGMVDLLSLKLAGARRSVEPRTLLAAWHRSLGDETDPPVAELVRLAADLGSGRVVLGSAVGSPQQLTLNASLYAAPDGEELANASVSGRAEQLPVLIDRLTAEIVSLEAGESAERMEMLTSTSLPALRAYLDGLSLYRRGLYREATLSLAEALREDSTFALAALHLSDASGMLTIGIPGLPNAGAIVSANRDRLGPRDHAYSLARFPAPGDTLSALERWEQAATTLPDRAEVWYNLADYLFHNGAVRGTDDFLARAKQGFERAVALDSANFNPRQHLIWISSLERDTAFAAREMRAYLAAEPTGIIAEMFRRDLAAIDGDSATIRRLESEMDSLPEDILVTMTWGPVGVDVFGFMPAKADRAAAILLRRATTSAARVTALTQRYYLEMNTGRPAAAETTLAEIVRVSPEQAALADQLLISGAIFWGGLESPASAAAERIRARSVSPAGIYALAAWTLKRGGQTGVREAIQRLRSEQAPANQLRADILEVWHASETGDPRTRALVDSLDAELRASTVAYEIRAQGNLTAARVFEKLGDRPRALAATRRVLWNIGGDRYISTLLMERGRLAALLGEREEARRAYEIWLEMMGSAEPSVRPEVERVRGEVQRLRAGG